MDLLVADIAMPHVDGIELIERIRQIHGGIPAVAVSAYASPEDRTKALTAGYNAYCAQPVEASELLRAASDLLTSS